MEAKKQLKHSLFKCFELFTTKRRIRNVFIVKPCGCVERYRVFIRIKTISEKPWFSIGPNKMLSAGS